MQFFIGMLVGFLAGFFAVAIFAGARLKDIQKEYHDEYQQKIKSNTGCVSKRLKKHL